MYRIIHIYKPGIPGYYIVEKFNRSTRWERFFNPAINEWKPIRILECSESNTLFATIEKHNSLEAAELKVTKLMENNTPDTRDIVKVFGTFNLKMSTPIPVPTKIIPLDPQRA